MPMFERNHRDSAVIPTMKCAQCNQDVHIRLIGQHDCTAQPAIPSLPSGLMGRGLSSFFRAPPQQQQQRQQQQSTGAGGGGYKPSQKFLAAEDTADEFDFDEMLHSAADFSIPSCENGRPEVGRSSSRLPFLPMFSGSSSSGSVDSFAAGSFSPLEITRVPGDNVYMPPPPPPLASVLAPARAEAGLTRFDRARDELMTQTSRAADPFLSPESESGSTHLDRARSDLLMQTSRTKDPVLSPESEPEALSFESRAYQSRHQHQQQSIASVLRPSINNNSNNNSGGNNGHKKTGSIAITAFPPVSPPESSGFKAALAPVGTTARRNNKDGEAAGDIVPPADAQIRISSRKAIPPPAVLQSEFVPTTSSSPSISKTVGGLSLQSAKMPERKITRNATAPPSMNAGSLPSRQQSPLDVLASLVSTPVAVPAVPAVPAAGLLPPRIDTQVRSRPRTGDAKSAKSAKLDTLLDDLMEAGGGGTVSAVPVRANRVAAGGAGAGKSLKSAKLDSLLDDLMGEMQALSAEVRTESDRESMASTASNPAATLTTSPNNDAVGRQAGGGARARFDSTVSSASSSSTVSGGGRRGACCATCGTAISGLKGAVVRSTSAALHNGEVAPGTAAVEHAGRVYCVRDYKRQFALGCRACGKTCDTANSRLSVFALDAWWHRTCFNCQECRQPFPDKSFYVLDQRPYCRYDYHKLNRSLCMACAEPIEGPCAQVLEGRFHPACFACAHCGEHLKDIYYSLNGRFLCEAHVHHQQTAFGAADRRKTVYSHV
ncbi:hypothetical protein GGI20_004338 [Coemansia sp. BCRC 34301]|nr:hypothetical protein GGI20_004338 [Coemansia sp. BCRC 34301]